MELSDDAFIEAFNKGGAQYVTKLYGGKTSSHRLRASRLRKKGHTIQKFQRGRTKKPDA